MLLSIVTITFNDESEFHKTFKSLESQSLNSSEIEWVIVNGGDHIEVGDLSNNIVINYLCEDDDGLYDAMNKGVRLAKGDYLLFLNSGDTFLSPESLEVLLSILKTEESDVVFWSTRYFYNDKDINWVWPGTVDSEKWLKSGNYPNHQGSCIKRSTHLGFMYNTDYVVVSDMLLWKRLIECNKVFTYYNIEITSFHLGGVSNNYQSLTKVYNHYRERKSIQMVSAFSLPGFFLKYLLWQMIGPRYFYVLLKFFNHG